MSDDLDEWRCGINGTPISQLVLVLQVSKKEKELAGWRFFSGGYLLSDSYFLALPWWFAVLFFLFYQVCLDSLTRYSTTFLIYNPLLRLIVITYMSIPQAYIQHTTQKPKTKRPKKKKKKKQAPTPQTASDPSPSRATESHTDQRSSSTGYSGDTAARTRGGIARRW